MTFRLEFNEAALQQLAASSAIVAGLQRVGDQVADRAAASAPKLTGEGAASIHCEVESEGGKPVAKVTWDRDHFYMLFSEIGTSEMPARPFLRPALDGTYNL